MRVDIFVKSCFTKVISEIKHKMSKPCAFVKSCFLKVDTVKLCFRLTAAVSTAVNSNLYGANHLSTVLLYSTGKVFGKVETLNRRGSRF